MDAKDPRWHTELCKLVPKLDEVLSPVLMAYRLSGYEITNHRTLLNNKGVPYRIITDNVVFFVWIIPVESYSQWTRYNVEFEFDSKSYLLPDTMLTWEQLPSAFSNAVQSAIDGPVRAFKDGNWPL